MTSRYDSQFSAICMGMYYAGRPDLYRKGVRFTIPDLESEEAKPTSVRVKMLSERQNPKPKISNDIPKDTPFLQSLDEVLSEKKDEVTLIDEMMAQFGNELPDCKMVEFKNMNGKKVRIASCRFRSDEWDCWMVDPETGMGFRA